jgi:hypothetical protein
MTWVWAAWWAFLFISFGVLEGFALQTNRTTLSRWMWTVSKAFPLLPFVVGLIVGVLACHFFWGGITSFSPVE